MDSKRPSLYAHCTFYIRTVNLHCRNFFVVGWTYENILTPNFFQFTVLNSTLWIVLGKGGGELTVMIKWNLCTYCIVVLYSPIDTSYCLPCLLWSKNQIWHQFHTRVYWSIHTYKSIPAVQGNKVIHVEVPIKVTSGNLQNQDIFVVNSTITETVEGGVRA